MDALDPFVTQHRRPFISFVHFLSLPLLSRTQILPSLAFFDKQTAIYLLFLVALVAVF
jgi:hypothetical protein